VASVTADASLTGILLNGRLFKVPVPPSEYADVLESPVRIVEPSPPAPYGHRNNQIHLFDDLGLYLIEHHATRLVDAVVFVLWQEESAFKPTKAFSGELAIGDVRFFPGMEEKQLSGGTIAFDGPVLGMWIARGEKVSITIRGKGKRQPSGHRSKRLRFVDVSFCCSSLSD
jgi:hypothetical protein